VFDGVPAELTAERVREIYGVSEEEFEEQAEAAVVPKPSIARPAPIPA